MNNEPVLGIAEWTENGANYRMKVWGGLHYIRGNSAPHFSLTMGSWRNGREDCFGASHEIILQHFPDLAGLATLHLSDIDGVPTHAGSNGWYWLAGALGGAGERYHGGNSKGHYGGEYREPTPDECLDVFARYCRVTRKQAEQIKRNVEASWNWPDMRQQWRKICEDMKPRWKQEAEACIAHHSLVVYGDEWPSAA